MGAGAGGSGGAVSGRSTGAGGVDGVGRSLAGGVRGDGGGGGARHGDRVAVGYGLGDGDDGAGLCCAGVSICFAGKRGGRGRRTGIVSHGGNASGEGGEGNGEELHFESGGNKRDIKSCRRFVGFLRSWVKESVGESFKLQFVDGSVYKE